ncbi:MAG TPA: ABC transporter permease [Candidatus Paceibacterota bacterium]|nr:ABC transporter permease [Candidatus Paceibacterota bacterium]
MNPKGIWISFYTMVRKDVIRIFRIWPQTFLPSVVTSVLYFLIFGSFLGSRIGSINNFPYISFVVPGIVMLAVVMNSYANVSFTFFSSKFFSRSIDEILVSPTPPWVLIAGFVAGGIVRGLMVGLLVLAVSLFFTHLTVMQPALVFLFFILTSLVFSLAGLVNGIYAKSIDGINIVPTFVLTPLVYLGGVFYSVSSLSGFWRTLTYINPIFYLVNGFRHGFLGFSDVSVSISVSVLLAFTVALVAINWYLLRKGLGLKQ